MQRQRGELVPIGDGVRLIYEDKHGKQFVSSAIADRGEFWWDPKRPNERVLWESKIYLGETFFHEIINHPVPLDMNTLTKRTAKLTASMSNLRPDRAR